MSRNRIILLVVASLVATVVLSWPMSVRLYGYLPHTVSYGGSQEPNRNVEGMLRLQRVGDIDYFYAQFFQFREDLRHGRNPCLKHLELRYGDRRLRCLPGGFQGGFPLNLLYVALQLVSSF